jgi:integrase
MDSLLPPAILCDTLLPQQRTIKARKRGPCLNRRTGQLGSVFQHCNPWSQTAPAYGRYYLDVPGSPDRKRRTVTLGICPSRSVARRKLLEHIEREGINSKSTFAETTTPAMSFRAQAQRWIAAMPTRRRRPVKPATIFGWQHALDRWILPTLGDRLLSEVSNGALRELIEKMASGGLAPKTIVNYVQVVKMVVASAVDADGEQIYPRKWNHDFVGLPIVQKEKQHRPTVTESEVSTVLSKTRRRYSLLFAVLAGTGLRIGEALALRASDFTADCRVLRVTRSIWHGKEQDPKTPAACREVDIAEPLAELLREYVADKNGYLFATASGRPLSQRNALRPLHDTGVKVGFHAFRRFRTETLRRARVPEDLVGLWLGHTRRTVTDLYATGLHQDRVWRREWCDRVGLGFSLIGLHGLQNVVAIDEAKAA